MMEVTAILTITAMKAIATSWIGIALEIMGNTMMKNTAMRMKAIATACIGIALEIMGKTMMKNTAMRLCQSR